MNSEVQVLEQIPTVRLQACALPETCLKSLPILLSLMSLSGSLWTIKCNNNYLLLLSFGNKYYIWNKPKILDSGVSSGSFVVFETLHQNLSLKHLYPIPKLSLPNSNDNLVMSIPKTQMNHRKVDLWPRSLSSIQLKSAY